MTGKPIGSLNGPWAVLLKITVVFVPVFGTVFCAVAVPWVKWVTDGVYASESHLRTCDSLVQDIKVIKQEIASMPPAEWRDRLKLLEIDSRTNLQDHASLKISLEQIKAKLGVDDGVAQK